MVFVPVHNDNSVASVYMNYMMCHNQSLQKLDIVFACMCCLKKHRAERKSINIINFLQFVFYLRKCDKITHSDGMNLLLRDSVCTTRICGLFSGFSRARNVTCKRQI